MPPPAAVCNAIQQAVGINLYELPMRPDRVVAAIEAKQEAEPMAAG